MIDVWDPPSGPTSVSVPRTTHADDREAILEVLAPLSETLDNETMTELNKQLSADGLPVEQTATDYLSDEGFIQ